MPSFIVKALIIVLPAVLGSSPLGDYRELGQNQFLNNLKPWYWSFVQENDAAVPSGAYQPDKNSHVVLEEAGGNARTPVVGGFWARDGWFGKWYLKRDQANVDLMSVSKLFTGVAVMRSMELAPQDWYPEKKVFEFGGRFKNFCVRDKCGDNYNQKPRYLIRFRTARI